MADHPHHRWLRETSAQIHADYERLHEIAQKDPQRAGHGGEVVWADLLRSWLPPSYDVVTRRYIVPEEGDDTFETDVVVLSPGYPTALRGREEIMAGGVAAAFCVRLTLDSDGISDAVDRAVRLRRGFKPRMGTPRLEMLGPYPVGLLAHAHDWTRPGSTPNANISRALEVQYDVVQHPRELLDVVCVANLSTWWTIRVPYLSPRFASIHPMASDDQKRQGFATTASMATDPSSANPVAAFMANLYIRLSYDDPVLRRTADGFRMTDTLGSGSGLQHLWDLDGVFDPQVIAQLPARGNSHGELDWQSAYW